MPPTPSSPTPRIVIYYQTHHTPSGAPISILPLLTAPNTQITHLILAAAIHLVAQAAELATLKADMDSWKAEQHKLLVAESQQHEWAAIRAENNTKFKLAEAQQQFGQHGLQLLLDEMKRLVIEYHIPEPAPESLPKGISSLYLTCWGRTPKFASIALGLSRYTSATEGFKEQLYKVLSVGLPVSPILVMPSVDEQLRNENAQPHYVYPKPDEIPDLAERREVLIAMATKFGCLQEVQDRVDRRHAEIIGQQRQENTASLQRQEQDLARLGYGRQEQVQPQESPTGCPPGEPHLVGCCCGKPGCGQLSARFRNSLDGVEESF